MKNILGLDLGTTSISFAHIVEDENKEKSEIKELGVRIVSLTTQMNNPTLKKENQ